MPRAEHRRSAARDSGNGGIHFLGVRAVILGVVAAFVFRAFLKGAMFWAASIPYRKFLLAFHLKAFRLRPPEEERIEDLMFHFVVDYPQRVLVYASVFGILIVAMFGLVRGAGWLVYGLAFFGIWTLFLTFRFREAFGVHPEREKRASLPFWLSATGTSLSVFLEITGVSLIAAASFTGLRVIRSVRREGRLSGERLRTWLQEVVGSFARGDPSHRGGVRESVCFFSGVREGMSGQRHLLVLRDLVFSYTTDGSPPLFEGLNFEVAQGEKVLLVGPNGSGKTPLLNLLAGLLESYRPRYQAFWAGKPVRLQEIRPEIAYAPDEDYLFEELTAEEHIEVLRALWTVQPTYRNDVLVLLRRFGLNEITKPVERYSRGMRRKLFLALILARRASL